MVEQKSRHIKASLIIDADLHARWCAAASLRNVPQNTIAVEALTAALRSQEIAWSILPSRPSVRSWDRVGRSKSA
ncbi:MAG: hypothetical protein JO114_02615 [Planctomycetaceae bacterium]|nr:hypothetical protein [Planctomycetaceae bacterium]